MSEFTAFLHQKRIDAARFEAKEGALFGTWSDEFAQQNPQSFFEQKRFLINNLRHAYPYTPPVEAKPIPTPTAKPAIPGSAPKPVVQPKVPGAAPKPVIKPKIGGAAPKPKTAEVAPKEAAPKPALKPKIPGRGRDQNQ